LTPTQTHLLTAFEWALMAVIGVLGLLILRYRWRRAIALERAEVGKAATASGPGFPAPVPAEGNGRG
jgi:hypothetical protein